MASSDTDPALRQAAVHVVRLELSQSAISAWISFDEHGRA